MKHRLSLDFKSEFKIVPAFDLSQWKLSLIHLREIKSRREIIRKVKETFLTIFHGFPIIFSIVPFPSTKRMRETFFFSP